MKRAFWIWNIPQCEKGDPLAIAAAAHRAGLTDVFVKVADGVVKFGVYSGKDLVPAVVQALRAVDVRVWGWQYVYGNYPEKEEAVATQRIRELGLDGYIVDAESEFKKAGWDKKAETYLSALRQHNPGVTIAFSAFRWPSYHPEFPWAVFYKYCDINMPQNYWLLAHNAKAQTERTFAEFKRMGSLPIWPAGPTWKEQGWRPTLQEIKDFEAVAELNGAPLVSFWSWEHCRRDLPELWPANVITTTPPTTPDPVDENRLAKLEQKITDLGDALSRLTQAFLDLQAIMKK